MKKKPMRKCLGCGELKDKSELIRIVKTKEDEFFVDKSGKKNGRGAYICDSSNCFDKAMRNKGIERSFKKAIPAEIYSQLKEELQNFEKN